MKFYDAENHAKNLPDAYKKTTDSNNYKILEIERNMENILRSDLQDLDSVLSLDNAHGTTLDLYGERIGQRRGSATDAQYLVMLKSKIMRNTANGSYNSIINAVCKAFNCNPSDVTLEEDEEKPCTISKLIVDINIINKVGLGSYQTYQIFKTLVPIGMSLDEYLLEGTFCFAANEGEYDESAGFAFIEDAGEEDVGGTLGATEGDATDRPLPI